MSSKVTKKRFSLCKEKSEKLGHLLNEKKGQADVTEFVHTLKFLVNVFEEYNKTKEKERPVVPDEGARVEHLLKELEDLLTQLVASGRFLRFFTSNRVRKRLDQLNAFLFKEMIQVHLGLQQTKKKSNSKKALKEESENYLECIQDPEGKELWALNFGQTLMVGWGQFITALGKVISLDDDTTKHLRYILDNSNTDYVSVYKFADFLFGFGPLKQCDKKVQAVISAEWFHGFLSSQEAERLLERQPSGTYLIRFSKSKPGSFAIAYVDGNQRNNVIHTLIASCPPSGFKIDEAYSANARGRLFTTLAEVVQQYSYILQTPFRSDLSKQSWFHGDLSSQEAEELLAGEEEGSFLFRFSSKSGFLAVSYIAKEGVKHGLLESVPGGYKFDGQPPVYPTLQDVVTNLSQLLKVPITTLTFESGKKADLAKIQHVIRPQNPSLSPNPADSNYAALTPVVKSPTPTGNGAAAHYYNLPRSGTSSLAPVLAPPSNYGSLGPAQVLALNTSEPPTTPNSTHPTPSVQQYGKMPTPGTTVASSQNIDANQQYGVMPVPGASSAATAPQPNPLNQSYGSILPLSGTPTSSPYGSIANSLSNALAAQNTSPHSPSVQQYGKMPTPGAPPATKPDPHQQYGSMPIPGNPSAQPTPITAYVSISNSIGPSVQQYGKMPTPSSTPGSPAITSPAPGSPVHAPSTPSQYSSIQLAMSQVSAPPVIPTSNPQSPSQGLQYAKMPIPGIPTSSSMPPPGTTPPSMYSSISAVPKPIQLGSASRTTPANGPSVQQYGKMPSPSSSPGSPVSSAALSQYGSIQLPPKQPGVTPGIQRSASLTNTGFSQYGSISGSPGIPKPVPHTGARPATPSEYGSIPTPVAKPFMKPISSSSDNLNDNYGGLPVSGNSNDNYGGLPIPSTPNDTYGGLPIPSTPNDTYGGLPINNTRTVQDGTYGGLPIPSTPNDTYGGLPVNNTRVQDGTYGGLPIPSTPNDTYGGLPINNTRTDTYGGLPVNSLHNTNDNYGGLPVVGNRNLNDNYGGLPTPTSASNDTYGGLPSQPLSEYGGLPIPHQANDNYGGLPVVVKRNLNDNYGGLPTPTSASNDTYGGLPSQPLSEYGGLPFHESSSPGSSFGVKPLRLSRDNGRLSLHRTNSTP